MTPSRNTSATRLHKLLDIFDYLEIFPTSDARYEGKSFVTIIGRDQRPGFLTFEDAQGNIVTTEHWNLDFALKMQGDGWFIPKLQFLAIPSKSAAHAVAGAMKEFLPEPPILPSEAASQLRRAIRVNLTKKISHNAPDAVQYLKNLHKLFSLIQERRWHSIQALDSDIRESQEWPNFLKIIAHQVDTDIWQIVCDDSRALPNLSILTSKSRKAIPDLPEQISQKDLALGRVKFELHEYRIQDAHKSYRSNPRLIDKELFTAALDEAIRSAKASFEKSIEKEIFAYQGANLDELFEEVERTGIELDFADYRKANAECRTVDSLLGVDDFDSLEQLRSKPKTLLARRYLEDNIRGWVYERLNKVRQLIDSSMLEEAEKLLSDVAPITIDSESQRARANLTAQIERARVELKKKEREEEVRVQIKSFHDEVKAIRNQLDSIWFYPEFKSSKLDDESLQLICLWHTNRVLPPADAKAHLNKQLNKNDYQMGALWSARHAELAAMKYLANFGEDIVDVSIAQVTGESSEWKTHDTECDGAPFDVKNARSSYSSQRNYSELCIAKFKKCRAQHDDVVILGAFSEYVRPCDVPDGKPSMCQILGHLSFKFLNELSTCLRRITEGKFCLDFGGRAGRVEKFFPGWMFDHPPEFYDHRDEALQRTSDLINTQLSGSRSVGDIPKDLLILYGIQEDSETKHLLNAEDQWMAPAILILRECGLCLPSLVTSVIAICLMQASEEESEFSPEMLRFAFNPHDAYYNTPLGVFDPLGYVDSMISVFELIYHHNRDSLAQYSEFQLSGDGILRGRTEYGSWETIIAYCGGWTQSGPKCGKNPIHSGESKHCPNIRCCKLICPECGYCSQTCPECKPRQENWNPSKANEYWELLDDDEPIIPF